MFKELFKVVAEMGNGPSRCKDDMEGDSSLVLAPARGGRFRRL